MKIRLPVEDGYFNVATNTFCNLDCYLITPLIDAKWNANNLLYRSLITDKEGNVLSSGWPKFFNYKEKEDCYPSFENYYDWQFIEKIDGSLVICDYVNNQFSMRTRGTVSYERQENARDFELLPQRHPKIVEFLKENSHISLLFEIVTPNNVIVVRPTDINFYLLGAVNKNTMSVVSAEELTDIWRTIGPIFTPQTFQFSESHNLTNIASLIKTWKGKEGIVVAYNNNQNRVKLKSDWYCFIHRVKSQLNSTNNLIEFYVEKDMPEHDVFFKIIETEFDYEIAIQLTDEIYKIANAGDAAKKCISDIKEMIHDIRKVETRKEQAEMIKRNCPTTSAYAFSILDNKEITKVQWIKIITNNYK